MARVCGCGCLVVFIVPWLVVTNLFAAVPPNHVGIQFDTFSKQVDKTRLFDAGRHFTGPFVQYITFPLNIQNVQMELESRTAEGYPLILKVEFQYQLNPGKILELYEHYTVKYAPVFQRNVRAALMKSVSDYDASDLFLKRKAILDDMEGRIDSILRESYATCWGVQFDDVKQPDVFENTLLQTELQRWFAQTKLAEQRISAIQANTSVLKAEFDKNISVVNSTATAECKYIISQAEADAKNYENEAQANGTLLLDAANAYSSSIMREATAQGELEYQEATAEGNGKVLAERAQALMRSVKVQGLQLQYWKEKIGLSADGMVHFQRLLGSYKHLEDVKFLFGFKNTYATAEASPGVGDPATDSMSAPGAGGGAAERIQMAAVGGAAATASSLAAAPRLGSEPLGSELEAPDLEL